MALDHQGLRPASLCVGVTISTCYVPTYPPADPRPRRSIGLFIYTQVLHKSSGTTSFGTIKGYSGSTLAWTMLKYINSAMGKVSRET